MRSIATATLDSTGRIVLPSEVRKRLRLETGARFSIDVVLWLRNTTQLESQVRLDLQLKATY